MLTDADVEELKLTFYIPCVAGVYNLIPSGRYIKVTKQNADEYITRVDYEYQRLLRLRKKVLGREETRVDTNSHSNEPSM